MNKTLFVSTRRFEGDDAVRTKLTIDMSQLSPEDMAEYVVDAAVIKWQASIRRKKDAKVPTEAAYIVPKPGTRAAAQLSPAEMLEKQFGKERADWMIAKFGSAEAAIAVLQKQLDEMEQDG